METFSEADWPIYGLIHYIQCLPTSDPIQTPGLCLELGHNRFLTNFFPVITNQESYYSTQYHTV